MCLFLQANDNHSAGKYPQQLVNFPLAAEACSCDDDDGHSADEQLATWAVYVETLTEHLSSFYNSHRKIIWIIIYALLLVGYVVYFCYAIWYSIAVVGCVNPVLDLIGITVFACFLVVCAIAKRHGGFIYRATVQNLLQTVDANWSWFRW